MKWGLKIWNRAQSPSASRPTEIGESTPQPPPPLRAAGAGESAARPPPPLRAGEGGAEEGAARYAPFPAPLRVPEMEYSPPARAAGTEGPWNTSFIPPELRLPMLDILNRDFIHIWDDPTEKLRDAFYPVVIDAKTDELCWKRDEFVMDAMVYKYMDVNFEKLATDLDRQWFRRSLYKRMGHSLKRYCEIFCK